MWKSSPDWLEEHKADVALFHLLWSEDCPSFHDGCEDHEGWTYLESNENCFNFEEDRACVEYGHQPNEKGVTANEAYCACGGGIREHDELELFVICYQKLIYCLLH